MNLHIKIPSELEQSLKSRATTAGKDVETDVVESLQQSLAEPALPQRQSAANFLAWLNEVRELIPSTAHYVDDSRDSIYAGRDEEAANQNCFKQANH